MPRWKDTSDGFRETTVAAHLSGTEWCCMCFPGADLYIRETEELQERMNQHWRADHHTQIQQFSCISRIRDTPLSPHFGQSNIKQRRTQISSIKRLQCSLESPTRWFHNWQLDSCDQNQVIHWPWTQDSINPHLWWKGRWFTEDRNNLLAPNSPWVSQERLLEQRKGSDSNLWGLSGKVYETISRLVESSILDSTVRDADSCLDQIIWLCFYMHAVHLCSSNSLSRAPADDITFTSVQALNPPLPTFWKMCQSSKMKRKWTLSSCCLWRHESRISWGIWVWWGWPEGLGLGEGGVQRKRSWD